MSDASSLSSRISGRYATAVFELASEANTIPAVEADLAALSAALDVSAELRDLISSPIYSRDEQAGAMAAVSKKMGLGPVVTNTLALLASKRRLFILPQLIVGVQELAAKARGEVTAEVISAVALSDDQRNKLAETLKATVGKDVAINVNVDESIIGGLIVKMGSKMIDNSIASKLANLQNAMKEVG
ncbi:MAG TPA: F0F1 ATP synthase subunit delta [Paracoccaceae bacterium]|nr:F0F1 ATP synthase subunit delta [Paracoccaceae bacterium]